jgi:hypothetical protein
MERRLKRASALLCPADAAITTPSGHHRSPSDSGINGLKETIRDSFRKSVLGRSKSSSGSYNRRRAASSAVEHSDGNTAAHKSLKPKPYLPSTAASLDTMTDADHPSDFKIPLLLQRGTPLLKISSKKAKTVMFALDADAGIIRWESKKGGKSTSFRNLLKRTF